MNTVRFALAEVMGDTQGPAHVMQMSYKGGKPDTPELMLTVQAGDPMVNTVITLPLGMISQAVAALMAQHEQTKNGGLVGFDKPSIILKPS